MRILFLTARPPWPSRRGDQARTAGWVSELAKRHTVSVVALQPPGLAADPHPGGIAGCVVRQSRITLWRNLILGFRLPGQVALHVDAGLRHAFELELARFRPDVVVPVLSRVGWLEPPPGVPVVLDLIDSLELNLCRRAHRQRFWRPLLLFEARRIGVWERRLAARSSAAAVVSRRDREALIEKDPRLAGKIRVVPFGLPVPDVPPELRRQPRATPGGVVLLSGNLGYFPTVDAALWLSRQVWPRLRALRPDVEWWLAGARPGPALRRLARQPGIRLFADPEDLGALRRRADVAVVPLRSGSGTPIKILEAMADGVPVVTTSAGRQGLDDLDEGTVEIADTAESFVEATSRLLEDRARASAQSRRAFVWVRRRHALGRVARTFEALLEEAVAGSGGLREGSGGSRRP